MESEKPVQQVLKRAFDIAGAATLLVVLSPVIAFTALAVKSQKIGPVMFKQTRYGKSGQPFKMLKFRSMRALAPGEPDTLAAMSTRLTPVTRFLRKSSLDELPQLFNILKGDMSLVGPRPASWKIDSELIYSVRPGLTGPAQVNGRNGLTAEQRQQIEEGYAASWSLRSDFNILGRTIPVWLLARGYQEADSPGYQGPQKIAAQLAAHRTAERPDALR